MTARTEPGRSGRTVLHEALAACGTAVRAARRRLADHWWPILQQAVAASLSWWFARHVLKHEDPLFAPMATVVALNSQQGERGTNAVRVVFGVAAGVVVGQVASELPGSRYLSIAAAVFLALIVTVAADGSRTAMAQAAVSAVVAVAVGSHAGVARVFDALLGGAVALVFSQLLFPANPLRLLRSAESDLLSNLARALEVTAQAMRAPEDVSELRLWERLRPLYSRAADLSRVCGTMLTAARRSPRWWRHQGPLRNELASAAQLGLLGNSCLTLTREAGSLPPGQRVDIELAVNSVAAILWTLAASPADWTLRRQVARQALGLARQTPEHGPERLVATWESLRWVIRDLAVFAGARGDDVDRALEEGSVDVPFGEPATEEVRRPT